MLGFKKTCQVCGVELSKESGVRDSGKNFCSEEHAKQYKKISIE